LSHTGEQFNGFRVAVLVFFDAAVGEDDFHCRIKLLATRACHAG
jgi:hypothetical protein